MNNHTTLSRLPATELRERVASREISPVEVTRAALAQIERHNGTINAVCTLSERALDDAQALEKQLAAGKAPGLLCGLPVGIKDVTPVAGVRTTYGSPLYRDHVPKADALVVQRLRAAGAIIIGKTNTPEFATGGNTFNEVFGRTRNPWNPALSAGGSTGGGAAALACGMIALAEGTDLGGSLRIPASFCGVVGLRPSPGLVPTYPADYAWDTMSVTGPMARTAGDIALMLQAVSGPSPLAPVAQPTAGRDFVAAVKDGHIRGLKLAYCPDIAGIGIDPEIEARCRQAAFDLKQTGAEVEEIELDLSFAREPFLAVRGYWMVAAHYHHLDRKDHFGSNLKGNVEAGLRLSLDKLGAAEQARGQLWQIFYDLFQKYDHLLTPCMAVPPFPVEQNYPAAIAGKEMKTYIDWVAPTFTLSLTGLPVGSVPCGLSGGLPVGMQIVGRPQGEEAVLLLARHVQEMQDVGLPDLARL